VSHTVDVIAALKASPAVMSATGGRIYAVKAPQDATLPNIVVTHGRHADTMHLSGANGPVVSSHLIVCRAEKFSGADTLGDVVADFLTWRKAGGVLIHRDNVDGGDYLPDQKAFFRAIGVVVTKPA
jgi:hypothetical protein